MSQSESCRVAHCMYVEIEFKKKKNFFFDFESLALRKFRKITAISHPCSPHSQESRVQARLQGSLKPITEFHLLVVVCLLFNSSCSVPHQATQTVAPNHKIHAALINLRYFEGSESFSFILCLLVRIDI